MKETDRARCGLSANGMPVQALKAVEDEENGASSESPLRSPAAPQPRVSLGAGGPLSKDDILIRMMYISSSPLGAAGALRLPGCGSVTWNALRELVMTQFMIL